MRVISKSALNRFIASHPDSENALLTWYSFVSAARWNTPTDLRNDYATASFLPDHRVVFNIRGNNYRLVTMVFFEAQRVYIRFVGTHEAYDDIDAETI
jgi:mRNA interferase HigB